jgi:hypothetical protein
MSKSVMIDVDDYVGASCVECPAVYVPPEKEGAKRTPSAFVRKHVGETGHRVRVTRRKVTTYGPR